MKRKMIFGLFVAIALLSTSCASILSKSVYPISIKSTPSEAKITIENSSGLEVYSGTTPARVMLNASEGFFKPAHYRITFEKEGHAAKTISLVAQIDGLYFVNILAGGLIGMLIVDPATGAMFALNNTFIDTTLSPLSTSASKGELKIYDLNEIPKEWVSHLVKL